MPTLNTMKPLVAVAINPLRPRHETERDRSRYRDRSQAWRSWYKTGRWRRLRWAVLVRDRFTCRLCGAVETDTSRLVCDHVNPHSGDEVAFWAGPFQVLCKACHDGEKQAAERRYR